MTDAGGGGRRHVVQRSVAVPGAAPSGEDAGDRSPSGYRVAWLGHATADIRLAGARFVTDPLLRDRIAHLRRHAGSPTLEAGPPPVVLISHLHHDHLDLPSLARLPPGSRLVVPRGARAVVGPAAGSVIELEPDDELEIDGVAVTAVPAIHPAGRTLSRARAAPLGYVLRAGGGPTIYFAGDTDVFPAMADLPAPDLALLPIWGWGPNLGPGHLDPERAARAAGLLRARAVLPVHWGTFAPFGPRRGAPDWFERPGPAFAAALARHAPDAALRLVPPGSTVS